MNGLDKFSLVWALPIREASISHLRLIQSNRKYSKKMSALLDEIENDGNTVLYALDETAIRLESRNYYSWSPIGKPTVIEKNNVRKGLNVIGATEISKEFKMIFKAYPNSQTITAQICVDFLKKLLRANPNKNVIVIWDNARVHTAKKVKDFVQLHEDRLHFIVLPTYSPELNPQENIWKWYKDFCSQKNAFKDIAELATRTRRFFTYANSNQDQVKSRANARAFYK